METAREAYNNLRCDVNNLLFVKKDGKILTVNHASKISKEITKTQKLPNPERYSAYSFRIGGATRAHNVGIDHPKILKFVGWADNRLPHVSYRYMRYDDAQLSTVPYEMVHGPIQQSDFTKIKICMNKNSVFDPWSECIKKKNK